MRQLRWVTDDKIFQDKLNGIINDIQINLSKANIAQRIDPKFEANILSRYKSDIIRVIESIFPKDVFKEDQKTALMDIAIKGLTRDRGHNLYSGIVVAGFGKNEQFPGCFSIHINQLIDDCQHRFNISHFHRKTISHFFLQKTAGKVGLSPVLNVF